MTTRKAESAIERLARLDSRFFRENPGRRHRLRPAHHAEIAVSMKNRDPIPAGFQMFAVVKQVRPGLRAMALLMGGPNADKPEAGEAEARDLFNMAASPERPAIH